MKRTRSPHGCDEVRPDEGDGAEETDSAGDNAVTPTCMRPNDALGLGEQMMAYGDDFYNGDGDRNGEDWELLLREMRQNKEGVMSDEPTLVSASEGAT